MDQTKYTKYFTSCKGVFQGGGCKAIAYVGAYKKAYERGVFFSELAGASAGAIIAALIAAGAKPSYLEDLVKATDFKKFIHRNNKCKFSDYKCIILKLFRRFASKDLKRYIEYLSPNSFQEFGIFSPKEIEKFLDENLRKLAGLDREVRFCDLIPNLHIVCADLKSHSIKIWNKEHTPDASVAKAVCASCSIPLFFQPVDKQYVDGGLLSNLPNFIFNEEPHYNRILCFRLKSSTSNKDIDTFSDYILSLVNTIVEGADDIQQLLLPRTHEVVIPTGDISATDFNKLDKNKISQLIERGETAMDRFLNEELTFSPNSSQFSSSFLLRNEEQVHSLVSYISLEKQKEIYICSEDSYWSWQLFLSLVRWIKNGSRIVVFVSDSISSKYEDEEKARRRMLKAMGCELIETRISITGYFFLKSRQWKGIVFSKDHNFMAQYYNSLLDSHLVRTWILKLTEQLGGSARIDRNKRNIQLHKVSEQDIIDKLKQEPIYENAQFMFETIKLDKLLFLNPYIRALKYKQIDCLFEFYTENHLPPFSPAAFKFANGKNSLIGPPVIEVHNDKYYIIEGNTRCVYAYRHGIKELRVLVVRDVTEEIPCDTHRPYEVSQILISDKKIEAKERYQNFSYDKFRHIEECIRPYKEYML